MYRNRIFAVVISTALILCGVHVQASDSAADIDRKRNKLIGYMLSKHLPSVHFSEKEMDDELSRAAFDLYLKQLDFQKRFLVQYDVAKLSVYADTIDDNLTNGTIILPVVSYEIFTTQLNMVEEMVAALLADPIDLDSIDYLETDPEKLDFAVDPAALRERWRLIIKAQIINRYLELEQDYRDKGEEISSAGLLLEATERVGKRLDNFFDRLRKETLQDHFDRYFNAVARAFDPHTNYMAPDRKEDFDIQMRGSLEGIGALLREEDGLIKVVRVLPGSATARHGGMQAEDTIVAVAEKGEEPVEVTDMRLREAVRLIRGPKGTEVELTIRKPDGMKDTITITRDVVQIEDAYVRHTILESGDKKFGYINIPSFYRDFEKSRDNETARNSTQDTKQAILALIDQDIEGIILDLRNNGGGSLVDAVDIAGLFIEQGPVVQVKNSYGLKRVLNDEDDTLVYGGPLVVLVNRFSASASEIVAAALQDYRRAVIVGGDHTHGKGTVQTIINLNDHIPLLHLRRYEDLGALKATIQKFYRVDGDSTQYRGVEPDIVLPTLYQYLESGEQYLDYSLPWDKDAPADYLPYTDKITDLTSLVASSRERVTASDELQSIAQQAIRSHEQSNQTLTTLTLTAMRERREQERREREALRAHGGLPGDSFLDEADFDDSEAPTAEQWRQGLQDDPYVSEAELIITELATQFSS